MSKLGRIVKSPIKHVEAKIEAKKENVKEHAADILSKVIIFAAMAFVLVLFLLFASILLANYLNILLDHPYWGYGIVAGIYLLAGLILFALKDTNFIYKRTREYANYIVKVRDRDIKY